MDQISITVLKGINQGFTLREIGAQVELSASNVLRRKRQLEEAGYLMTYAGESRLTDKGRAALANPDAYPDVTRRGRGHGPAYTDRERAIITAMAGHHSTAEIAAELGRSEQSVKGQAAKMDISLKVLR